MSHIYLAGMLLLPFVPVDGAAPRPAPLVLDGATRAKLREIAFEAAREGDVPTLSAYLADRRLPVNEPNARGDTLLIVAAYHGHEEAVATILARRDVEVDAVNRMGFTALTGAAFQGDVPVLGRLLKAGADPNRANGRGQTPLMFAAMFGRLDAARALLKAGADPSARDAEDRTPLDLANRQGADAMAALLRGAIEGAGRAAAPTPM